MMTISLSPTGVDVLIRATDEQGEGDLVRVKGDPVEAHNVPHNWGAAWNNPQFVILNINDKTRAAVEKWLNPWQRFTDASLVDTDQTTGFNRIRVNIDPELVRVLGDKHKLQKEAKDYITDNYPGTTFEQDHTTDGINMYIMFPPEFDLGGIKRDFIDTATYAARISQYRMTNNAVNFIASEPERYASADAATVKDYVIDLRDPTNSPIQRRGTMFWPRTA